MFKSLLMVTALLTLAGYFLNDTVVTFDHIWENMKKSDTPFLLKVFNDSVNEVLTVFTALEEFISIKQIFLVPKF